MSPVTNRAFLVMKVSRNYILDQKQISIAPNPTLAWPPV